MEPTITQENKAFGMISAALAELSSATPTRELSLVKTKLEEAAMWLNKDRTFKGEFEPNKTHLKT